jgi:hypothetical protein
MDAEVGSKGGSAAGGMEDFEQCVGRGIEAIVELLCVLGGLHPVVRLTDDGIQAILVTRFRDDGSR